MMSPSDVQRLRSMAAELRAMRLRCAPDDVPRLDLGARHAEAAAAEMNQAITVLGNLTKSTPKVPRRAGGTR